METRYLDDRLLVGNCLDTLKGLKDASIDSIVTDPPYEIGFMGRSWDSTGIAYNVELWAECLRVLKPGGHLLAFGATRSYHRMACAIEDAGFEIRDSIHWTYGSGFPKSHNVGKATGLPEHDGLGTAMKPSHEPIVVARRPLAGTVAANVLEHGTGALNIDGCRVGSFVNTQPSGTDRMNAVLADAGYRPSAYEKGPVVPNTPPGRWPANTILTHAADCGAVCAPGCPAAGLDAQSGTLKSGLFKGHRNTNKFRTTYGEFKGEAEREVETYGDSGGASRFFTQANWDPQWDRIVYVAKPSKAERNAGLPKGTNVHPTVKPVACMRHLIRLVTPPGGTVLDPFLGSGTTAVAAILEGMDWKGCELTEEYLPIIRGRVQHALDSTDGQLPFE